MMSFLGKFTVLLCLFAVIAKAHESLGLKQVPTDKGDHDLKNVDSYIGKSISSIFQSFDLHKSMSDIVQDPELASQLNGECFNVLQEYANHFQNHTMEIAQMVLYSGRDLNDLGRYEACNELDFTRYISFGVSGLPIGIYLGICGPIECKQEDYQPLSKRLAEFAKSLEDVIPDVSMLEVDWTEDNFRFVDSKAHNAENTKITPGFIFTIIFFAFFIICCILGTIFEMRLAAIKKRKEMERRHMSRLDSTNEESEDMMSSGQEEEEIVVKPRGALQNFLYSFAVFNNTRRLIYGRGAKVDKQLEILNGIRVLAISFVILGHTILYSLRGPVSNPTEFLNWIEQYYFSILLSAPYTVDIFFWLSGFLGGYLMLELLKKKNGRNQPYYLIMLHRFLRLTPLYFATILFFWFIMAMAGNGPIFFTYKDDYAGACNQYWWSHLLFINNFYPFTVDEQCMGWTWYLPNDMQFFLLLPPLVYFLYRYRIVGILSVSFLMIGSFTVSIIILALQDYSPSFLRLREDYYRVYYMKPYMRITPFLIGILLGFFIYSFRNDAHEDSIVKRFCDAVKHSALWRHVCYWGGVVIMAALIISFYDINKNPDDYGKIFNAFYMTLSRPLFVFGMVMSIFPVLLGRGKVLRDILGHDWFTPLARISFGAYLVHPTYMVFESFNRPRATWASMSNNFTMFFAWLVISFLTSFLFTILVETPCANLEKTFLMGGGGKGKKKAKKFMKVPAESFENSFSKGFMPKSDSDNSPTKADRDFFMRSDSNEPKKAIN